MLKEERVKYFELQETLNRFVVSKYLAMVMHIYAHLGIKMIKLALIISIISKIYV